MIPFGDGRPNPPRKGFFHAISDQKSVPAVRVSVDEETRRRKVYLPELREDLHREDRDHHVLGEARRRRAEAHPVDDNQGLHHRGHMRRRGGVVEDGLHMEDESVRGRRQRAGFDDAFREGVDRRDLRPGQPEGPRDEWVPQAPRDIEEPDIDSVRDRLPRKQSGLRQRQGTHNVGGVPEDLLGAHRRRLDRRPRRDLQPFKIHSREGAEGGDTQIQDRGGERGPWPDKPPLRDGAEKHGPAHRRDEEIHPALRLLGGVQIVNERHGGGGESRLSRRHMLRVGRNIHG
jgi:hypothetical protein